ncbi:unnamed protein product [Amoebophrya sp. A120]|nr:unnamed protein product [Amoebophrya sp. A120]|eukprot:GSA120T00022830001.1
MHDNGMLQDDEKTMLAFASGRDMLLLTTKRVFRLDTKGWTGNRTQYLSIPYSSIRSFECATAGRFDSDGELMLELNGNWPLSKPDKKSITLAAGQSVDCTISQDLSSGSCDMTRVAQLLGDRIIANNGAIMGPEIPQTPPSKGDANAMIAWLNGRDMGQLDADACKTMTETFKSSPNIMMADEFVEMGFTGRSFWGTEKQFCLFTPHRVLAIEQRKSLFSGSKWYYKTIPWKWACGTYVDRQLGCCDTDQILQVDFHSVSTPQLTLKLEQDKCDLFQCTNYVQRKLDALTQHATAIKSSGKMSVQQNMKPEATPAAAPENVVLEEKPGAEDKTNGESTAAPAAESA